MEMFAKEESAAPSESVAVTEQENRLPPCAMLGSSCSVEDVDMTFPFESVHEYDSEGVSSGSMVVAVHIRVS